MNARVTLPLLLALACIPQPSKAGDRPAAGDFPVDSPDFTVVPPTVGVALDTGALDLALLDAVPLDLGFVRSVSDSDCLESRHLGIRVMTVRPSVSLRAKRGTGMIAYRDLWRDTSARIADGRAYALYGYMSQGVDPSTSSPALARYLLEAYWQDRMPDRLPTVAATHPVPRTITGLLARTAVSARWGSDYAEHDHPFLLEQPFHRELSHALMWIHDAIAWSAVVALSLAPDLTPSERLTRASAAFAVGAGLRLSTVGWPLAAQVRFRNRFADAPYRWPATPRSAAGD